MDFFNIIQVCLFFYIIGKEIMENSGCYWDTDEDKQLTKLYSKYKMELTEIAEIHKRSVLAIEKRLEKLGLIVKSNTSCENIVWKKFGERLAKKNPNKEKWELLCETISESINEKFKELNNKIDKLQLNALD